SDVCSSDLSESVYRWRGEGWRDRGRSRRHREGARDPGRPEGEQADHRADDRGSVMSESLGEAVEGMCARANAVRDAYPAWIRWPIPKPPAADRMMRELTERGWSHLPGYADDGHVAGGDR